jgi:hypothetical protein
LTVEGKGSEGIIIDKTDLTGVKTPVQLGKNAKTTAVDLK